MSAGLVSLDCGLSGRGWKLGERDPCSEAGFEDSSPGLNREARGGCVRVTIAPRWFLDPPAIGRHPETGKTQELRVSPCSRPPAPLLIRRSILCVWAVWALWGRRRFHHAYRLQIGEKPLFFWRRTPGLKETHHAATVSLKYQGVKHKTNKQLRSTRS